jgi:glutaconate CoA-transferase subunit B
MMIPNVILSLKGPHERRALVDKVDFISAPGVSPPEMFRPGGPIALVTGRCIFDFDKARERFVLRSLNPGHSAAEVRENTGFDYDERPDLTETPEPSRAMLTLLHDRVLDEVAAIYPKFADELKAEVRALIDG